MPQACVQPQLLRIHLATMCNHLAHACHTSCIVLTACASCVQFPCSLGCSSLLEKGHRASMPTKSAYRLLALAKGKETS